MEQPSALTNQKPSKAKKQLLKGLLGKLTLLTGSTAICLLLLELIVRSTFPFFNPKAQILFHVQDGNFLLGPISQQVRQAALKGDFDLIVSFNKHGFRDAKDLRDSSERDIFVVGDSFSMGFGVDEDQRYSNLLQAKLGRPVYNISIPEDILGYSKLLEYAQNRGAKVRNLIVGVCMENDLRDYRNGKTAFEIWKESAGKNLSIPTVERLRRLRVWFRSHSALYIALTFAIKKNPTLQHLLERAGLAEDTGILMANQQFSETVLESSRDELVKLASRYNSVILIVPSRMLWCGPNRAEEAKIHDRFVQLVRQAGLPVVDMKPIFERNGNPLSHYFTSDSHWNPKGHLAAGDALLEYFQSHQTQCSSSQSF